MPYNGSGTYSLPSGNPVVANTTASSTTRNSTFNDVATALTNALTKDGQSTPTANITLGGYRLTNVGDATSLQDCVPALQIQNNNLTILSSVSGTDTITAALTPTPSAYAAGQIFAFVPAGNNPGPATLNVSSLGAKSILLNSAALVENALVSGEVVIVRYNGTEFDIIGGHDIAKLGASSNTFLGDVAVNGDVVIGTAGNGIDFSATTGTGTSELLDDYEEGIWTPLISDGTNNATNIAQVGGCYTKVGRLVTLTGTVATSSLGSVSGNIRLTGFPFATPAQFYAQSAGAVTGTSGLNITAGQSLSLLMDRASAFAYIQISDAATGNSMMTSTQWTAGGGMTFSLSYVVE